MKATQIVLLTFLLFLFSCNNQSSEKPRVKGIIAKNGVVTCAHPYASQIGLDVLKNGGNAFDAAIAVKFALAVVYPRAGNIGGGGFMVYRTKDGKAGALDFREKAPLNAYRDMYLDDKGDVIENLSKDGHLAAGVPGVIDGMVKVHKKFGTKKWNELINPAINYAKNGVILTKREADKLNKYRDNILDINTHYPYIIKEQLWNEGDTMYHKDLGETLVRIRDNGRDGFYKGKTADLIVAEMKSGNGIISHKDLENYNAVWREPVSGKYHDYKVYSMPPPSSGGIAVIQLLNSIEKFPVKKMGFNTVETIHLMTELERRIYADRATYMGDADFYNVPVNMLLDPKYLAERMSDIDMTSATSSQVIKAGEVEAIEHFETTHFSIVDKEGNAVSITTTLNGNYGCKVMVKGAGFFLNNEMDDFSVKPGVPNMFGLVGGEANAIQAEKRMLSSMSPTIVEKDGKLFMVLGTNGGSTIITSVFQTILNVIDHDMTLQEAVNARRVHSQWLPDRIFKESNTLDTTTILDLNRLGHKFETKPQFGKVNAIKVNSDGTLEGVGDYTRGDDTALGY